MTGGETISRARQREARRKAAAGAVAKLVKDYFLAIGGAALVAIGLRVFVVEAFRIPGDFMAPTLLPGDHIFVNKVAYGPLAGGTKPVRGDVIVFTLPNDPTKDYIKRVIGVAGDTVEIRNGEVVLNGRVMDRALDSPGLFEESLGERRVRVLWQGVPAESRHMTRVTVPPDQLFVLGDNRAKGQDSRSYGFLPVSGVKGRASWIWLSLKAGGVRWSRMFTRVE
jgi:signal peptidase I